MKSGELYCSTLKSKKSFNSDFPIFSLAVAICIAKIGKMQDWLTILTNKMKKVTFSRSELHTLVWNESLPSLAKKYDATYHELRKICTDMKIPLPLAGYWQNKWLGKVVSVTPLYENTNVQQQVTLSLLEEGDERKPVVKRIAKAKEEISENYTVNLPPVSAKISKPDPLIIAAQKSLNRKEASYGQYREVVHTEKGVLDIRVAPKNIQRALGFMDTMLRIFQAKGYPVIFKNEFTYVKIVGEELKISVKEIMRREEVKRGNWVTTDLMPTGLLSFRVGETYEEVQWKDGATASLEEQIPQLVLRLENRAEKKRQERIEREKYWAVRDEEERIRKEIEHKKEQEEANFKRLLEDAEKWQKFKVTRIYLDAIEQTANSNNNLSDELKEWLIWARKRIEDVDPINKYYQIVAGVVEEADDEDE